MYTLGTEGVNTTYNSVLERGGGEEGVREEG